MKEYSDNNDSEKISETVESSRDEKEKKKEEVMCWKDPYKVCQCAHPQEGIFCGRYPFPTD